MTTDVETLRTRLRSAAELAQNRHILIEAAEALRSQAERIKALEAKCAELGGGSLTREKISCIAGGCMPTANYRYFMQEVDAAIAAQSVSKEQPSG